VSFCPEDFNSTPKTLFHSPDFGEGIDIGFTFVAKSNQTGLGSAFFL
jgi:hypothetical protein